MFQSNPDDGSLHGVNGMERFWIRCGAFFSLTSVCIGAFAAHGLKHRMTEYELSIIETAARYQMVHGLAVLISALLLIRWQGKGLTAAPYFFSFGVLVFCGSLYALAWTGIRALGAITPIGGTAFIFGWTCLLFLKKKEA